MSLTRRQLFQYAGAGATLLGLNQVVGPQTSSAGAAAVEPRYTYDPAPFCLGVASGDPLPDGIVLWTRLVPKPRLADQGLAPLVPVRWQLASDEGFSTVVRSGTFQANSTVGHSVHVDVRGLQPGTTYWYRFNALGVDSPIGRTRTAPAADAANQSIRFASGNCQAIGDNVWYPAWRDIAADDDLDFVVHLGDYIYERGSQSSLAVYRNIHETYKGDRDLRDAHRRHPFFVTWDDHEVVNDYSGNPASLSAKFLDRRSNAYRAWYEHMPVRLAVGDSLSEFKIHQHRRWGTLMDLTILDLRQYRSAQNLPNGTIVGATQKQWFLDNVTRPDTGWQTVCNSIMFSKLEQPTGGYYFTDQWDGFIAERKQVTQALQSSAAKDVVFITGDWHSAFVCDVYADFAAAPGASNPVVATEFIAHSISSSAYDAAYNATLKRDFAVRNPHIKDFEGDHYGYDLYEITPTEWKTHQRVVGTRSDRLSPVTTLQSWAVERGQAGAVRI